MIGAKFYQRKSKVLFFLVVYGLLALIGAALTALSLAKDQNPSGAEGFTLIFGAGMAFLTWSKSRKPRIVILGDCAALLQQNRPDTVKYKAISTVTHTRDNRLVLGVRDGHGLKNVSILLNDLEKADADKLVDFFRHRRWKGNRQ